MEDQSKASEGQQAKGQEGQQKQGSDGQQQAGQEGESKTEQLLSEISKKLDKGQQASVADQQLLAALMAEGDDGGGSQKTAQNKGGEFRDSKFEDMSNTQLADAIMKKVSEGMEAMRSDLDKDLKGTRQSSVDFQIKQEVKEARDEFKEDFEKHYDATMAVARQYPMLPVREAYLLATAPAGRGELLKLQKAKTDGDNNAADAGLGIDSIDMGALTEEVKGKSTQDTAREIAKRIGLH